MANTKDERIEFKYDRETEELIALEGGWYQDYSVPPHVERKWVEEGDSFWTTPRNAETLLKNCLAIREGQKMPKMPANLNWSAAAYMCAQQAGFGDDTEVIGTGIGGRVLIRDINRVQQELMYSSPQYQVVRA